VNANDWAAMGVAIVTLLVAFSTAIRHLVKHYLSELRPNHGSSVKDQISRLESRVDEIYSLLLSNSTRR
jgi:CHASE1-domain containing sensor protein